MGIIGYIFGGIIAGIVIAIFCVLVKKDNEDGAQLISNLSEEQINVLKASEVFSVDGRKNTYICTAMVARINDKGNKVAMRLLYYD